MGNYELVYIDNNKVLYNSISIGKTLLAAAKQVHYKSQHKATQIGKLPTSMYVYHLLSTYLESDFKKERRCAGCGVAPCHNTTNALIACT